MMPVVFKIPFWGRDVPGYGLMLCLAFLVSIVWAAQRAARSRANPDVILNCGFIALFAGVIGSRTMFVIHYWDERFAIYTDPWRRLIEVINLTKGGVEFYGGFMLASVAVLFYLWKCKHSIRWYLDIIAPSAALGLAIGRIGCFLNGCCFGAQCNQPWAIRFPFGSNPAVQQWLAHEPGSALPQELIVVNPAGPAFPLLAADLAASDEDIRAAEEAELAARNEKAACQAKLAAAKDDATRGRLKAELAKIERRESEAREKHGTLRLQMKKYGMTADELRTLAAGFRSQPVHPTQLYSTITAGLIALLLNAVYWRRRWDGQVICLLFMVEPLSRYLIELIRADNPHDTFAQFTISQFLAICLTLTGVIGFFLLRRLPPRSRRAVVWEPPEEEPAPKGRPKRKGARATG